MYIQIGQFIEPWLVGARVYGRLVSCPTLWTAIFGGTVGTYFFVELNRNVFSLGGFRPYRRSYGISQIGPQLRLSPRIEPIVSGLIERLLIVTAAIVLIRTENGGALAGAAAVYVGLKSIKRTHIQPATINVSIHSLWGTGLSVGFAVLGGWLFNHISPAA